jgi:hypothetical protein
MRIIAIISSLIAVVVSSPALAECGSVHEPFDCRDHAVPNYPKCSCKAG